MSVELEEAKENISKRLQFIESEVTKVEKAIGMYHSFIILSSNYYP